MNVVLQDSMGWSKYVSISTKGVLCDCHEFIHRNEINFVCDHIRHLLKHTPSPLDLTPFLKLYIEDPK